MNTNISIQGQLLEIRVEDGKLKEKWHNSYVCVEYANSRFRTHTCSHGGRDPRNPSFKEKFQIPVIEGLKELTITVWNENKSQDTHIGTGLVSLHKVISEGDDDTSCPIQTKHDKYAGIVHLVMHFSGPSKIENPSASTSVPPLPPSYPFAYPPVGGYPYPYAPTPAYPPPSPPNPYTPAAYSPAPYPQYGPPYPTPAAAHPPYYQPPGPYPGYPPC